MIDFDYLHLLEGRLRAKVHRVERCPVTADSVKKRIEQLDGMTEVVANPTTGNVLVHYQSDRIHHDEILRDLKSIDVAQQPALQRGDERLSRAVGRRIAEEAAVAGCLALLKIGMKLGWRALAGALAEPKSHKSLTPILSRRTGGVWVSEIRD